MDDETNRLQTLLQELHGQLAQPENLDETRRTQLTDLRTEVERLLGQGAAAPVGFHPAEREKLQTRLQQLTVSFEGAHPQFLHAVEETMNALSNMGL